MANALLVLIPITMLGVVVALVLGMRAFLKDGQDQRERSNRMMQWRVGLQFAAVALILLFVLIGKGGL